VIGEGERLQPEKIRRYFGVRFSGAMGSYKLKDGFLAECNSAIDQINVTHPQAGFMPSPPTYLHSHELSISAPPTIRNSDEISKVSYPREGKVYRPGRRGSLKCERCRKQKRGRKVGHHLVNFEPNHLGSVCALYERSVQPLYPLPQGGFGFLLRKEDLS